MPAKLFVDTNIWLYSLIQGDDPAKQQQAAAFLLASQRPVISSRVVREICSNLLRKAACPESRLRVLIEAWYRDCEVIASSAAQHLLASNLRQRYALSYWDSLIVAAALDAGCSRLISEDMQHGQIIEGVLTITNPFLPA